jgi:hypothetical protein
MYRIVALLSLVDRGPAAVTGSQTLLHPYVERRTPGSTRTANFLESSSVPAAAAARDPRGERR